jgi:hypothetical protein
MTSTGAKGTKIDSHHLPARSSILDHAPTVISMRQPSIDRDPRRLADPIPFRLPVRLLNVQFHLRHTAPDPIDFL